MYLLAFIFAWQLGVRKAKSTTNRMPVEAVGDLIFYGALGAVLGGRIGYALFYNFPHTLADPLSLVQIWQGGMSFHGGLTGVIVACYLYSKKLELRFFEVVDFAAPLVPLGLGFGRVGNFINAELPGRVTEIAWGMHYPCESVRHISLNCRLLSADSYEPVLRHPSALYQAFAEGIVFAVVMFWFARKPRRLALTSGVFLVAYGCLRFTTEFFRYPDAQIGFILNGITLGQLLSLPLAALGLLFLFWEPLANKKEMR